MDANMKKYIFLFCFYMILWLVDWLWYRHYMTFGRLAMRRT